jgi:hypothetical protein
MKRILLLLAALLSLSGCGEQPEPSRSNDLGARYPIDEFTVPLSDGREVVCLFQSRTGIDCDWDNATTRE